MCVVFFLFASAVSFFLSFFFFFCTLLFLSALNFTGDVCLMSSIHKQTSLRKTITKKMKKTKKKVFESSTKRGAKNKGEGEEEEER